MGCAVIMFSAHGLGMGMAQTCHKCPDPLDTWVLKFIFFRFFYIYLYDVLEIEIIIWKLNWFVIILQIWYDTSIIIQLHHNILFWSDLIQ